MLIKLTKHDQELVTKIIEKIEISYKLANMPAAVIKKIGTRIMKYRNNGREQAKKRHPFKGICEKSGLPIERVDAHLDELEPEKGYQGKVRWVCPRANNSGRKSCGKC